MSKEKFTFRVEADLLKEMKKLAIDNNMPLNELLIESYQYYKIGAELLSEGGAKPLDSQGEYKL